MSNANPSLDLQKNDEVSRYLTVNCKLHPIQKKAYAKFAHQVGHSVIYHHTILIIFKREQIGLWPWAMEVSKTKSGKSATRSDKLRGKRRKAKTDHLVECRFRILLKFHDQGRMAESVDETRRKCGVS